MWRTQEGEYVTRDQGNHKGLPLHTDHRRGDVSRPNPLPHHPLDVDGDGCYSCLVSAGIRAARIAHAGVAVTIGREVERQGTMQRRDEGHLRGEALARRDAVGRFIDPLT